MIDTFLMATSILGKLFISFIDVNRSFQNLHKNITLTTNTTSWKHKILVGGYLLQNSELLELKVEGLNICFSNSNPRVRPICLPAI